MGKGISVSTGAPLGAEGEQGRPLGMPSGHLGVRPGLLPPTFGEWGGGGCWGLVSFGGQIGSATGCFRGDASGCMRGLALRVGEGQ